MQAETEALSKVQRLVERRRLQLWSKWGKSLIYLKMKFIVYQTICTENNKIYIGVHGTDSPDEFDGYIGNGVYIRRPASYKKSKTPFQYAVNKYGVDKFIRTVLKVFDEESDAYKLEAEIVNEEFIKRADTYNLIPGGRHNTNQAKQYVKVYMYDLDGNFIRGFDTVTAANKFVNPKAIGGGHLSRAIRLGHTHWGFQFSYEHLPFMKKFTPKQYKRYNPFPKLMEEKKEKKPIAMYDMDGNFVKEFSRLSECAHAGYKNAKQVILGKRKHCKNFIFKYVNED